MAHGPSCSAAYGILPDRGSNPCPLHWQAASQPLRHQGSPVLIFYRASRYPCRYSHTPPNPNSDHQCFLIIFSRKPKTLMMTHETIKSTFAYVSSFVLIKMLLHPIFQCATMASHVFMPYTCCLLNLECPGFHPLIPYPYLLLRLDPIFFKSEESSLMLYIG